MSKDFCKKVWGLIYEEAEGHPPEGMKAVAGDKVIAEVNLIDIGSAYGAALDLTEGHPFGHAQRVAFIAQELAFSMGIDANVVLDVTLAGLFHDVGLLRITHELNDITNETESSLFAGHAIDTVEEIANSVRKGGLQRLSELLIAHTQRGAELIQDLSLPVGVASLVEGHHERYDGHGYPLGIRGDGIIPELRVLTAADCLETAIERAGERGHSPEFVRGEAAKFTGNQMDPEVAKQLVQTVQNVRFWGTFTGGGLGKQLANRLPEERLQVTYGQVARMVRSLVELVDGKSPYREGHSWDVARNSFLMALELGMAEDVAATLGMAGLLHDLGKSGVSNQILDKPKWLTGPEYEQAKKHIYYTQKIVEQFGDLLSDTQESIALHHERLDGSGYPNRLKGEQLGKEVRILATADVYDALISDRPYRKGLDPVAAVRFMEGKVNRYFDPEVLAALGTVVKART